MEGGFVDHYIVLGLPSGEEALKLSEKEILKAYKLKALDVHPDKRPDDPDAHEKFQKVKTSYEVLKDEKDRKLFDDLLRIQLEKEEKKSQVGSKRRKMMSDLEERERRSGFAPSHHESRDYDEEERIARKLKEEVDGIRARHAKKRTLCGDDISTPLLVVPLQRAHTDFVTAEKSTEAEPQSNMVGAGYLAYENDVMERLKKASMDQKR